MTNITCPPLRATRACQERGAPHQAGEKPGQPDEGAHDQQEADIVVPDVAHFVGDDAFEFLTVHNRQQAGGGGDGGALWADTGGEGICGGVVDDVNRRLGQALSDGQGLDDVVELAVRDGVSELRPRAPRGPSGCPR